MLKLRGIEVMESAGGSSGGGAHDVPMDSLEDQMDFADIIPMVRVTLPYKANNFDEIIRLLLRKSADEPLNADELHQLDNFGTALAW